MCLYFQMLAESLLQCHKKSIEAGKPLALKVFQSGRGRLENEGSIALAEAFKVFFITSFIILGEAASKHK